MKDQENQIIRLLLNELAFEGAIRHFSEAPPELDRELFDSICKLGIPQRYNGDKKAYDYVDIQFYENTSVFKNCYRCMRTIRNNIIHANKAFMPDPPERLNDLLAWTDTFINAVYATESSFSDRATQIKQILRIRSY